MGSGEQPPGRALGRRGRTGARWRRWWRGALDPFALVAMAGATGVVVLGVVIEGGMPFVGLLVAAPLGTASFSGPRATGVVAAYAFALAAVGVAVAGDLDDSLDQVRLVGLAAACAGAVAISYSRERRELLLGKFESATRGLQDALRRPLPGEIRGVSFAARVIPSDRETEVGGDVLEVVDGIFGTRVLVADACGHGPGAVRLSASLGVSFREAAARSPSLAGVAGELDEVAARLGPVEEFATALLLEIDGPAVTILNFGHHAPLLVTPDGSRYLEPPHRHLPLGFRAGAPEPLEVRLAGDQTLIAYTDGIVEARPASLVDPFDLAAAVAGHDGESIDDLVEHLVAAVRAHTGGTLDDDVALVAVRHGPARVASLGGSQ